MFKLEELVFNHNEECQRYRFTDQTFIYGDNTVGKTAMTKAINFVLGSSENLTYQGLDNIDSLECLLSNELTVLWCKRTVGGEFYYKRTEDSSYSEVSMKTYKDNICLMLTSNPNSHYVEVYRKVFEEMPTYRSFNFLNYIEEKGLGDLSVVFTKAREMKHQIRIRSVMNYFFNFRNIEHIYNKQIELENNQNEFDSMSKDYQAYQNSLSQIRKLFSDLQLNYTGKYDMDYSTFVKFKTSYTRESKQKSKDLVYLSKASFSLSEEIKLYSFMKLQSKNMVDRKERSKRLLAILNAIVDRNDEYGKYTDNIIAMIKEIEDENVILSLTDYNKVVDGIRKEKDKLDRQIEMLKGQAAELNYEDAIKKIGVIEEAFSVASKGVDVNRITFLQEETERLKQEIKNLRLAFNAQEIKEFNKQLTDMYINCDLAVKHLEEDRRISGFSLEFDPFKLCLFACEETEKGIERFIPGSMTRQTHMQILIYLCMFDYLKKNFNDFIYMPLLIIDSANQPMGIDVFEKVYPTIVEYTKEIGLQMIFLSKDRLENIPEEGFIDISNGLNKFHNQSK